MELDLVELKEGERLDRVNADIRLIQKTKGFSYGTDAVLLAAYIRHTGGKAAEFGGGTGIVSLLCEQKNKFRRIYSVECQEEYFDLLKRNIAINNSSVIPLCKDIRKLRPTDCEGELDCVFTNPPYMKVTSGRSSRDTGRNSARHEAMGDINDFCRSAGVMLKHGGLFYCVYRPDRLTDLITAMRSNGIEPKRMTMVYPTSGGRPCMMLAEGKKGASSSMFNTKPLIIYKETRKENPVYTEDMKKIYEESDFDERYILQPRKK